MMNKAEYRYSIHDAMEVAAKKVGIEGWRGYEWENVAGGQIVRGCVPDGLYTKGHRKGQFRFNKPIIGSDKIVLITSDDLHNFAVQYEKETYQCWDCKGSGHEFVGWSKDEGLKVRDCVRCNGTGKIT
jgi:hypothetical protein